MTPRNQTNVEKDAGGLGVSQSEFRTRPGDVFEMLCRFHAENVAHAAAQLN